MPKKKTVKKKEVSKFPYKIKLNGAQITVVHEWEDGRVLADDGCTYKL